MTDCKYYGTCSISPEKIIREQNKRNKIPKLIHKKCNSEYEIIEKISYDTGCCGKRYILRLRCPICKKETRFNMNTKNFIKS